MRTNEGIEQKIQNNNKKTISESYLYSLGRKTTNEMTNFKRFRHKGKPTTKTSIYIFLGWEYLIFLCRNA